MASVAGARRAAAQGPRAPGLTQPEMAALAPKVQLIRVEPKSVKIHVGEVMPLDRLTVTVFDSAGKNRGRLASYDFVIAPNQPASAFPGKITGVREGTTELVIHYPTFAWRRPDPRAEAKVKIVVVK